ncbi:MAG: helix-turn-helix domain-containing protein [Panacagrimonas sp.]
MGVAAVSVERRAVDAFQRGVRRAPVVANDPEAWGGVAVCEWKLPFLDGFELAENDDFIIAHHSEGSRKVRASCNGPWSQTTSTPGLISVIPPDRRVEYTIEGEVSFSSIHVPRRLLSGLAGPSLVEEPGFRFAFEDAFASACIENLLGEARRGGACNFPYVHAMTRALILHLMQGFRAEIDTGISRSDSGLRLDAMLDFIDSRLTDPLKIDELADRACVSRAHFIRRFRDVTGMSPHRYITLRRVEKAKELLLSTRQGLAQIALDVGFGNQSHFTQVFHVLTGATPSQFRRARDAQT